MGSMRAGERIKNVRTPFGELLQKSLRLVLPAGGGRSVGDTALVPKGIECRPVTDDTPRVEIFRLIAEGMNILAVVIVLNPHGSVPVKHLYRNSAWEDGSHVVVREQEGRGPACRRQGLRRVQP